MLYHGVSDKKTIDTDLKQLLDMVGLPQSALLKYPHEFSGGQRQRIGIAKALSLKPEFIVCDEPVSALDVSIQAQILNLIRELQNELGLTSLFVGHGLGAVRYVSDRIAVMYLGKIVEIADAGEVFMHPVHPYTKALTQAAPVADPGRREEKSAVLTGEVASAVHPPKGCRFHPRCPYAREDCSVSEPMLLPMAENRIIWWRVLITRGQKLRNIHFSSRNEEYYDEIYYQTYPDRNSGLLGITVIDYAIMCMAGSPLEMLQGPRVSEAAVQAKAIALGLDKPFYVQYFVWLGQLLHGNMGYSIKITSRLLL